MPKKITNEGFQKRLRELNTDVYTDDLYTSVNNPMNFYCSRNHHWNTIANNVLNKNSGCPYCYGRLAIVGETDLWTTRPDVAMLLKNPKNGYILKENSKIKDDFVCPTCGSILNKPIQDVSKDGLICTVCGDGISYPNKFARAMLKQLDIQNVVYEWNPEWLKPYLYDNYFIYKDMEYVLEMDGGIGHGNVTYMTHEKDTNGILIDIHKDYLAESHNVDVIRIDCDYGNNNRFEYIKNSILNSRLIDIFDLSIVDWNYCNKVALSSMVCRIADMYNNGMAVKEIIENSGYCHTTIHKWLKQAASIGICNYDPLESKRRSRRLVQKPIHQYDITGNFMSWFESQKNAEAKTGINTSNIQDALKKRRKSAGGSLWFYADDPDQPDKSKIIPNNTKLIKEVS